MAHFVIATAERASLAAFQVNDRNFGKPQQHLQMMLDLLVYAYANGLFSSRLLVAPDRAGDAPRPRRTVHDGERPS